MKVKLGIFGGAGRSGVLVVFFLFDGSVFGGRRAGARAVGLRMGACPFLVGVRSGRIFKFLT